MSLDVRKLAERHAALKTVRNPYEATWEELARLFLPLRYKDEGDLRSERPEIADPRQTDSVGVRDMTVLAAGMQGGMTSPVRPWFKLTLEDSTDAPEAGTWLDDVTERMRTLLHRSNFYNVAHALYGDLGTFGQALLLETADWTGLRFTLAPCGTYVLDVNEYNEVDTFFRTVIMTARQIVAAFGDSAPDYVRRTAEAAGERTRFPVVQAVFPRTDRVFGKLDSRNMPYASVWYLDVGQSGKLAVLRESGYQTFPAFAPRWDVTGTDVYGRSPAMNILPDCRMLQAMGATTLKGTHKAVDPPWAVPANLKSVGVNIIPGAVNYLSVESMQAGGIQPLQQVNPQTLAVAENKIQAVQQAVHDGLYTDLFKQLMLDDRRQITATEIEAREREKLTLLGPVVERLDREFLSPLILRTYQLMAD
ncbi:MAG: head-tail connector protein [Desulfovibrio sp.]|nr:head-tail connector protein [Desulfovibrio sp.]